MIETIVITVDGPSGVGKGTLALRLAQHYNFSLLDSGALYRLVAYDAISKQIPLDDEIEIAKLAASLDCNFTANGEGGLEVFLHQQLVTDNIRTEKAGNVASIIAAIPAVRSNLLQFQRDFATGVGLIADGRDMGTTVFPNAPVKLFLTASANIRAERRYNQLKQKGINVSLPDLVVEIEQRDDRDKNRASSPLVAAEDATIIDTTELSIDAVEQLCISVCDSKLGR